MDGKDGFFFAAVKNRLSLTKPRSLSLFFDIFPLPTWVYDALQES
jgi:hypothetical protein